jgi:hypothetical protein
MAQGRVVASGRLSEILTFELRGWELVISHASEELRAELERRVRRVTPIAADRLTLDLAPDAEPAALMHELAGRGARLVSLNPVHETLEDYFMQSVNAAVPRDTARL